jgi:MFS family permease
MVVFYGWWIVLACFIIAFYIGGSVFFSFTAFVDPIVAEFDWSYTQISIAASLRGLEMGVFAPLVGIFVDRFGSKIVILIGIVIVGFSMILLSMTNSLPMFYGISLLVGLGAGGCTGVVVMSAVANWFNRKISLALGLAASGFGSGGLLLPVIVWMIDRLHWRTTLQIIGLTAWVICIPLSFVIRGKPEKYGYFPDGEEFQNPASDAAGEPDRRVPRSAQDIPFNEALKDRSFWYFNAAEAIRMVIVFSIMMHVMPYLNSLGVPRSTAGFVAGALALFSVLGRIGLGYLGDAFDKRYILAVSYSLMALGLVVFSSFIRGQWSLFLFLILFAPGYGGGMTVRSSLLREYFGTASYGKILGITMGIGSIAAIFGPPLAGWTFDTLGSYRPIWLVYVGLIMVAIALVRSIKPLKISQV